MRIIKKPCQLMSWGLLSTTLLVVAGCGSDDGLIIDTADTADTGNTDTGNTDTADTGNTDTGNTDTADTGNTDTGGTDTGNTAAPASCEEIAAAFQTNGSANADMPDPAVSAVCNGDSVVVNSNGIPDFPYIVTSPGTPNAMDLEYTIPVTPVAADEITAIPALGAIGVAVNGIPIYGATEGTGGDVLSLGSGFTECGGHNGPTGYHYHTFDVTGSDVCRFSEAEAAAVWLCV